MIAGVANVWMPVSDVDLVKKFYSETLELSIVKADGGPVLTFQPEGSLDDIVSEHEWGRVATFRGSEGNEIQLYEPPKN